METEGSSAGSLSTHFTNSRASLSLSYAPSKEQNPATWGPSSLEERNVCPKPCPRVRRLEKIPGIIWCCLRWIWSHPGWRQKWLWVALPGLVCGKLRALSCIKTFALAVYQSASAFLSLLLFTEILKNHILPQALPIPSFRINPPPFILLQQVAVFLFPCVLTCLVS